MLERINNWFDYDGEDIARVFLDPIVTRYLDLPRELNGDSMHEFLKERNHAITTHQQVDYAIMLNHRFCGYVSFSHYNKMHHFASIGFALQHDLWGKNIMPDAIKEGVTNIRKELNIHRIEAQVHADNLRSLDLLRKSGFRLEGIQHENFLIGEVYHNCYLMAYICR
jgi:[ribosomal protein S5]-alanine N-acetyltransferase